MRSRQAVAGTRLGHSRHFPVTIPAVIPEQASPNPPPAEFALDKRLVRRSFDRAADSYDKAAFLQQEIGNRLVERLELVRLQPTQIVDVGAGTGHVSAALSQRYPDSRLLVSDLAEGMLHHSRRRLQGAAGKGGGVAGLLRRTLAAANPGQRSRFAFVSADAEQLPLADASTDLLVSNLMLQWCPDLDRALAEFRRVLAPEGLLMFTTFGPDTLKELRAAWAEVDGLTHVNAFIDMHDIGDAVMRAGLSEPVMDVEKMTVTYPELRPLMRDLKDIGAHNVSAGRRHGITGRQRLARVSAAYEQWRSDGVLPASYEVIYGHAWAPAGGKTVSRGGEVRVQLDSLRPG